MGCSPYFGATGTHPLIPLDISEATYLQPPPESVLSSTELIARRAIALQKRESDLATLHEKVHQARFRAAVLFEQRHTKTIYDFNFERGNLVLMRNSKVEYSLNKKMKPRYLGPLIVVSRNKGGAYILCELDGTVLHRPIAAYRVLPYLARRTIYLPDDFIDIDTTRLRQMEDMEIAEERDFIEPLADEEELEEDEPAMEPEDPDTDEEEFL